MVFGRATSPKFCKIANYLHILHYRISRIGTIETYGGQTSPIHRQLCKIFNSRGFNHFGNMNGQSMGRARKTCIPKLHTSARLFSSVKDIIF
ncbi:unnamed protein product [Coffea canephora]|uniref:Uncharacterized protein n=1 Tax=Coffea canephora TaxID=49390 RepID=A0A068USU5_COFCA|nr:unnamed protein product [Coffea canephora]